ncbi:MAG: hypothetical protein RIA65_02970, partial [Woeseia sp.]
MLGTANWSALAELSREASSFRCLLIAGRKQPVADVADGAEAATPLGDKVALCYHLRMGIRDGDGDTG